MVTGGKNKRKGKSVSETSPSADLEDDVDKTQAKDLAIDTPTPKLQGSGVATASTGADTG